MKRTELIEIRNKLNDTLAIIGPLEGDILNATDMNEKISNKSNMAFDKILKAREMVDDLLDRMDYFKTDFLEVMGECCLDNVYTGNTVDDYKFAQYVLELHANDGEGKVDNPNFDNEVRALKKFLRRWKKFAGVYDD